MKSIFVNTIFSFLTIAIAVAAQDCITRAEFDILMAQYRIKGDLKTYILVYTVEFNEEFQVLSQASQNLAEHDLIYNCYKKEDSEKKDENLVGSINRQPASFKQVDLIIIIKPNQSKVDITRYAKLTIKALLDVICKMLEFYDNLYSQSKL